MANRINLGAVKGETGATGAQGLTGAPGQNGITPHIENGYWYIGSTNQNVKAKGDTWYKGTGAPTDQGVNGDYYIDTATNDVYNKQNNVWSLATNIKGAKGDAGEQGENATSIEIGTVTTLPNGEQATAELVPLGNGAYQLNLAIPEGVQGERGEQGVNGNTTAYVGGLAVNTIVFSADPQTQIDSKLNSNLGSSNAGKMLIVGADGSITPATSSAEDDVIDAYITEGTEYSDEWLSLTAGGQPLTPAMGKIYLIRSSGDYYLLQFAWNGTEYEQTGGGDTSELATKSEAVGSIALTIDSSTYVVTLQAKNVNGTNIGTAQTIDLPIEAMIIDVDVDPVTKELILTLQNGNSTRVDVSDIVSGLQQEITANNKLSADLVDDTNTTNKFTNATEKATWNGKQNALDSTQLSAVNSGIDSTKVAQIATNTSSISGILDGTNINSFSDVETALADKQDLIDSSNKVSADLIDDTSTTNKFVTTAEKTVWNNKQDTIQYLTMPQPPTVEDANKIVQYIGEDMSSSQPDDLLFKRGHFYRVVSLSTDFLILGWEEVEVGGNAPTILTNTSASTWVSDNTYADYGYKCVLNVSGVTANDYAEVVFGVDEATSGNYAPVVETGAGTITIYSKVDDIITIPTIKVDKL